MFNPEFLRITQQILEQHDAIQAQFTRLASTSDVSPETRESLERYLDQVAELVRSINAHVQPGQDVS